MNIVLYGNTLIILYCSYVCILVVVVYIRLLNHICDIPHKFTIKVQVIRNTAHRPSMQASYTMGSGTTIQANQQAAQIAAEHM